MLEVKAGAGPLCGQYDPRKDVDKWLWRDAGNSNRGK